MRFAFLAEFTRELNKLLKKWHNLEDDLERLKSVLESMPRGYPPGIVRIANPGFPLGQTEIYKVTHFRCTDMKGKGNRSGIRIIYVYSPEQDKIEFVEMYYKEKDDRDCDKSRIKKHYYP